MAVKIGPTIRIGLIRPVFDATPPPTPEKMIRDSRKGKMRRLPSQRGYVARHEPALDGRVLADGLELDRKVVQRDLPCQRARTSLDAPAC